LTAKSHPATLTSEKQIPDEVINAAYRLQGERIAYEEIQEPLTVGKQLRNNST